jgi:probable HAF family extracellular repeat protein
MRCAIPALAYSATLGLLAGHAAAQVASIQFVPALTGGTPFSVAAAATPDGTYVVGYSGAAQGPEAYRWNRVTGQLDALGYLATADWFRSRALGVSDDGSVVVGRSDTSDHAHPIPRAFKWTQQTGMIALPYPTTNHQLGPQGSAAVSVSPDGSTIVGHFQSYATRADGTPEYPALMHEWCRWTSAGPQLLPPGAPAAYPGIAAAISGDGTEIAGYVGDAIQPTMLTGSTPTTLGQLPGGQGKAEPAAISRDGTTVVGMADTRDPDNIVRYHAFRWTQATGMTDLGRLPGLNGPSRATGVSADGSVVVATQAKHPLIWDAQHGMRDLSIVLTSAGSDLQGKVLKEAMWVSPDAHWVVGNADDPSGPMLNVGWIAHLP